MTLRVGHITYANCAPFFHYLEETGFSGTIIPGVPAHLNELLAAGEIDVSPSSSFEYGRNWRSYLLLPGHSISSFGAVRSVLLFSPVPIEALDGTTIYLTGESATSVNLLKILLRERFGHRSCQFAVPEGPVEELLARGQAALLIGDRALRAGRQPERWSFCYDLGALWVDWTGLPFVFALWILRLSVGESQPDAVRALADQLAVARRRAFGSLEQLAAVSPERTWLPEAELAAYWRSMDYDLGPRHLAGLERYFSLCHSHGLLPEVPSLRFFE